MSPTAPVSYDRRSFMLHGRPFLILSGSVHYIRLHPSRWSALFDTFIAARLNTLETYVFWGEHDRAPSPRAVSSATTASATAAYDFAGRRDLFAFLHAAAARGLHVILRIGPYVCAEVSYGGFPSRLRSVPGIELRTFNAPFMAEVGGWVRHVAARLKDARLLAPQGGPVILVQLENEYSMVSDLYGDVGARYLQWCADLQRELEFGVPGIMCYGAAEGVVETINAFYAHEHVDTHREKHPDQPPVWTECWTGWYDVWGAPHHIRSPEDLAYAVARFFAKGGAGINYYMWMGGTNFGRSPMYLQKTSYDYDAPIDEFYQETTKSKHLARLHDVLLDVFAKPFMERREDDADCEGAVCRWGHAIFICNDSEKPMTGVPLLGSDEVFDGVVGPKSVCIIDGRNGELRYDSSRVNDSDVVSRRRISLSITVTRDWEKMKEPVPDWDSIEKIAGASGGELRGITRGSKPPEQLLLTQDSSDYCFYVAQYRKCGTCEGKRKVKFEAADFATVFFNGKVIGRTEMPLWEDRWANKWNAYPEGSPGAEHEFEAEVDVESVNVTVVTASLGLVKGDWQLGTGRSMLDEAKGLLSDVEIEGYERKTDWKAVPKLHGEVSGWEGGNAGNDKWKGRYGNVDEEVGTGESVGEDELSVLRQDGNGWDEMWWYRCTVRVSATSEAWVVDLEGCGKGMLYVNGVLLGRYWLVAGSREKNGFLDGSPIEQVGMGEASQRYYHIPRWVGKEVSGGVELAFVMFAEYGQAPGKITLLKVE